MEMNAVPDQAITMPPDKSRAMADAYSRAEKLLGPNAEKLIYGMRVVPHWIEDRDFFWYKSHTREGKEFVLVDAESKVRQPAFDHVRLAAMLSQACGRSYAHNQLPFDHVEFERDARLVGFVVDGIRWQCDLSTYECRRVESGQGEPMPEVRSPDGQWVAFVSDHNLRVRASETGVETALTDDGEAELPYATPISSPLTEAGLATSSASPREPAVIWSPDSKRLLTYRIDARPAGRFHLVQSVPLNGGTRPILHSYAYALPGDEEVALSELIIFDVESRERRTVSDCSLPVLHYGSPLRPEWIWWSDDASTIYILTRERGYRSYTLTAVDAQTGRSRELITERGLTGIDPAISYSGQHNVRVLDRGATVLWYSQRDGWAHLYLYDGTNGQLVRQITSGPWVVTDVLKVDETERVAYVLGVGREPDRDPYYQHLYRVSMDGGDPELLTPEDATHQVGFSPSGRYFVDAYSKVDQPPVTVLRSVGGSDPFEIERTNVDALLATGLTMPERFHFKARDGITDVYGVLLRPSHFNPSRTLPILDDIYAGPQTNHAPVSFAGFSNVAEDHNAGFWQAQALAELGFAVVMIDGLGMPYRSKAFHDVSYRNLADGGVAEHIIGIRRLAERYPYLDLSRVGIYGHSAGGYSSAHALLANPEFYKVAVSSAGNHDHRLDKATWVERYMGLPVGDHYREQANASLAHNLRGKLLLIHGEMDENVHVASTLQLVDALIKANKDFDLLIMPNRSHACSGDPYFIRRRWDYFVRYLLGMEPPIDYAISLNSET